MQRKPRILVVGSFVMDVIATTEKVPRSAQTVYGKSFHMAPGVAYSPSGRAKANSAMAMHSR